MNKGPALVALSVGLRALNVTTASTDNLLITTIADVDRETTDGC